MPIKYRILLLTLLVITTSLILGYIWNSHYGYILITNGQWSLENSLNRFVVLSLPLLIIAYLLIRFIFTSFKIPRLIKNYTTRKHIESAHRSTIKGLMLLLEGRWKKAEHAFTKDIAHNETRLLNYLLAARAAQNSGHSDKRDEYLRAAHDETPKAEIAIGITQADLQIIEGQSEQALATLERLRQVSPKHPYVLKQISRLYTQLGAWQAFIEILPTVRSQKLLTGEELLKLERQAYLAMLRQSTGKGQLVNLEDLWKTVPRELRKDVSFVQIYISFLLTTGDAGKNAAEKTIRLFVNKQWNEILVREYGLLETKDIATQLKTAETWNAYHGHSPMLMLTLARLCFRLQLWGKSRVYYESSLGLTPSSEAYAELAELLERLGETDKATDYLRKGLALAINKNWERRATDIPTIRQPTTETKLLAEN